MPILEVSWFYESGNVREVVQTHCFARQYCHRGDGGNAAELVHGHRCTGHLRLRDLHHKQLRTVLYQLLQ